MFSTTYLRSFLTLIRRKLSPAHCLKFCGARPRVACAIMAHAASHVTFHGYFESTSTTSTEQSFSGAKDSFSADSYL